MVRDKIAPTGRGGSLEHSWLFSSGSAHPEPLGNDAPADAAFLVVIIDELNIYYGLRVSFENSSQIILI